MRDMLKGEKDGGCVWGYHLHNIPAHDLKPLFFSSIKRNFFRIPLKIMRSKTNSESESTRLFIMNHTNLR